MQKRFDEIDALRGFAIFLVVLGHSIIVYPINLHENIFLNNIYEFVSTFHLPLFFIISGFCFSYKGNYNDYFINKFKRLMIPYFVFGIINILLKVLFPSLINGSESLVNSIIGLFISGGQYWFLYTLFLIFLIYPLIDKFINNSKILSFILLTVLLIVSILDLNFTYFCLTPLFKYFVYFHCGVFIKRYLNISFGENSLFKTIISFIILVIIYCLYIKFDNNYLEALCAILGITFSYFLCNNAIITSLFKKYGKYSLQIYLLNGYTLVVSRTLICKLTSNWIIIVLFNLFIDFYISYVVICFITSRSKVAKSLMGIS